MRVKAVRPISVEGYLFIEIETDTGLVGTGEAGAWGFHEPTAAAVEKFAEYLYDEDPLRIESHWQYMYRWTHFSGSVVMAAISAIDIALWDIAGQHFDAPVHALLGGRVREKARIYLHVFGRTVEEICDGITAARAQGHRAVGHLTPFPDERAHDGSESYNRRMADGAEAVAAYRDAAGPDMDICIEIHRQLTPFEAVELGDAIRACRPLFYEDPVTPDNLDEMSTVAQRVTVPVATGERLTSPWAFQMLVARNAAQILRPDPCLVGGITGLRKVAVLAEMQHLGLAPHNSLGPVAAAACLQVAATTPSFLIQEFPSANWPGAAGPPRPPADEVAEGVPAHDGSGHLRLSDRAGLGVTLKSGVADRFPRRYRPVRSRRGADGAVVDH